MSVFLCRKYAEEEDETKQTVLETWSQCETDHNTGAGGDMEFQLVSRKWLTQFFWNEEVGPIDNSDIICPHGFMIPYEFSHFGATWIPSPVWQILVEKYDLKNML